jgi:ABC-type glycerol-3-phosphate transport system permease component
MSEQLTICLIAIAANLAGMLVIYAGLSHALAQLARQRRGLFLAIALIVIAQLFWIAPALGIVEAQGGNRAASYALWLGNWLVSGFSIVLFLKSATRIPVALTDAARMDGLGGLATWRRAMLPFVRRDLVVIALLTVMATLLPVWGVINHPAGENIVAIFERGSSSIEHLTGMVAASLLGLIPLGVIFAAAKKGV